MVSELKLTLAEDADLLARKKGDAPVAALWEVTITTANDVRPLGMATASELRKLLTLQSPDRLELFAATADIPACAHVMMFYDGLGPTTTLYAIPVEGGVELAWFIRKVDERLKGRFERSGIVIDPALVSSWEASIEAAQDQPR